MKDLKELKELCEKATPGPWYSKYQNWSFLIRSDKGDGPYHATTSLEENAAFIAAANPQTVLSLIERVEELEDNGGFWGRTCSRQAGEITELKEKLAIAVEALDRSRTDFQYAYGPTRDVKTQMLHESEHRCFMALQKIKPTEVPSE